MGLIAASRLLAIAFLSTLVYDAFFLGNAREILSSFVRTVYASRRLPGRPVGRLHIAVVTMYSLLEENGAEFRRLTERNFQEYCDRHGYDLIVADDNEWICSGTKEGMFAYGSAGHKFVALKRVLSGAAEMDHRMYDWAFWVDPDTLLLNHGRQLEDITDNRYDWIISTGLPDEPDFGPIVDTRHFMVRNSPAGHEILDDLIKMAGENCGQFLVDFPGASHTINGWLHVCNADGSYWNGDAGMLLALYTFRSGDYRCRFKKTHHRIMNSQFPRCSDGDLAVSFPDHMIASRKKLIAQFLESTDFSKGIVDRSTSDKLDSVDPGVGDWRLIEQIYDSTVNVPCHIFPEEN